MTTEKEKGKKRIDPSLCVRKTCLFHHFPQQRGHTEKEEEEETGGRMDGWMALLPVINVVPPHIVPAGCDIW